MSKDRWVTVYTMILFVAVITTAMLLSMVLMTYGSNYMKALFMFLGVLWFVMRCVLIVMGKLIRGRDGTQNEL